ncbi:hypothetical protein [Bacillus arachidis]|uniref:hypothetical protein n=1 Tax=Bacillus arachidis TaxID=2819290 RepID=UPI00255C7582|nr:hypothetical protein [Bacillus arachidis]WIY58796.1 hypothetical protein QRY57_00840 [Bacillus arachidis]
MKFLKLSLKSFIAVGILTVGISSLGFNVNVQQADIQQASSAVVSYAHGNTG